MKKIFLVVISIVVFLSACAPKETPTPLPIRSLSLAVMTVDMYYTFINAAQTMDDYVIPWNKLTPEEQCNPSDKCNMQYFYDRWSKSKVFYRLYDCGSNIVTAEEMIYPRESTPSSLPTNSKYLTYELVESDGFLLISDSYSQEPGAGCVLALERLQ